MIPNILFKVISNDPINKSIVVRFCRENAQKPIDEYRAYNICLLYTSDAADE